MTACRSDWPIVVGGCHRSGTSLVRRLLDAHPRIHCGPEVPFFRDFFSDYHDDPLCHLRFAQTARSLAPEDDLLEILGRGFVELHQHAAKRAGKPRWADKSPDNVVYTSAWQRILGSEWVFIHVVRNPLDTLASMEQVNFPLTLPASLEDRISFYRRYIEHGLEFGRLYPERYRRVIYEQLCAEPNSTLAALMESLGEEFISCQLEFNDEPRGTGLEDPKIAATSGVMQSSIGRWPSFFDAKQVELIWGRTRDLWERVDPDGRWFGATSALVA